MVVNSVPLRLQLLRSTFINVYAPTGNQGENARRNLFSNELLTLSQTVLPKPVLVGDWNCLSRKEDVEDWESLSNVSLSQRISVQLQQLVRISGYVDGFLHGNSRRIGYTWRRRGKRCSRLDRVYIPSEKVMDLLSPVEHQSHLSDHDALVFVFKSEVFPQRNKFQSNYWKMNKAILQEPDFNLNFIDTLNDIKS